MSHEAIDLHDHVEPPTGRECAHYGKPQYGVAMIDGRPVCHTGGAYPDCYRLVSVYDEPLGSRHPEVGYERVRRLLEEWEWLGRGGGEHGRQLRTALDSTPDESLPAPSPAEWKPSTLRRRTDK